MINLNDDSDIIDYEKYLNCPDCKKNGLYCDKHRAEVEQILGNHHNKP